MFFKYGSFHVIIFKRFNQFESKVFHLCRKIVELLCFRTFGFAKGLQPVADLHPIQIIK